MIVVVVRNVVRAANVKVVGVLYFSVCLVVGVVVVVVLFDLWCWWDNGGGGDGDSDGDGLP